MKHGEGRESEGKDGKERNGEGRWNVKGKLKEEKKKEKRKESIGWKRKKKRWNERKEGTKVVLAGDCGP